MPILVKKSLNQESKEYEGFPVDHYSYSMFSKFSSDPQMFKVGYINGDRIDTTVKPTNVIGKACHEGLKIYFEEIREGKEEGEAIKLAHQTAKLYLDSYSDGFIEYNTIAENRTKLEERFAFAFFGYIKEMGFAKSMKKILLVEKMLQYKIEINDKLLPIPLKGSPDVVARSKDGKIRIRDHKFTGKFSDPDSIDAGKLLQAAFMYFLVWADLGERPYSIVFEEFKITQNRIINGKVPPQLREFEIVFEENSLMFDLFYRFYEDVTNALLGKQVYIPNIYGIFDREVSILSYIHKLDITEEREKQFKRMKVDNVTDFLKKKIQKNGAMKKYLDSVSKNFVSGKTLNYKDMTIQEKIKYKMAEHGLGLEFDSLVTGGSVTLYRYEPSIGLKMSRLESYVKDIEQVVETSGIRVLAPIKDSGLVGFEVPNKTRTFPEISPKNAGFNLAIGVSVMGDVRYYDVRTAPHILVAGSSGSGKSVFLNGIIKQLQEISNVDLHLFDPKQVELFQFEGKKNVVEYQHNHSKIIESLKGLIKTMEERYTELRKAKARNIEAVPEMKYKFIIIDEFADLTLEKKEAAELIQLLAQKGRACGIHVIIATQRASTKIISGDIKVNFGVKVVFKMAKAIDSRVMLDEDGAEKLLGKGDMLFSTANGLERLQGFLS